MLLKSISFEGYKPFIEKQEVEIRPLTIFLGRNAAGKSSVVRLIPLMFTSLVSGKLPGLALLDGEETKDLFFGRVAFGDLSIGARFESGKSFWQFETQIKGWENGTQLIESHWEKSDMGQLSIRLSRRPRGEREALYEISGKNEPMKLEFKGLLPILPKTEKGPGGLWLDQIASFAQNLVHISPFRTLRGQRFFGKQSGIEKLITPDGANAPMVLQDNEQALLPVVQEFFGSEDLGSRGLELIGEGSTFGIYLKRGDISIPLSQVGQGMEQVFPLVVQRAIPITGPRMEIVEEPESHLHPGAHGKLADLYVDGLKDKRNQFVIETHSEVFLLRVRRRIAEGVIDPDQVALYWVDDEDEDSSRIKKLEIQADGVVENWPEEVFAEDYEEARAIRRAVQQRTSRS
ncbi:MAG: DUF3696 domain-containing protein [Acidobacteriota bacterium]|nr:DUF3696 domain-containing protein [Acidobacteriota bacterium]